MGKGGRLEKYKGSSSRIWEKDEYRSETIKEIRYSRRKRF